MPCRSMTGPDAAPGRIDLEKDHTPMVTLLILTVMLWILYRRLSPGPE